MSCVDLPAPSPPGCDRPRPARTRCPRAGGRRRTAAPEHGGTCANLLRGGDRTKADDKSKQHRIEKR